MMIDYTGASYLRDIARRVNNFEAVMNKIFVQLNAEAEEGKFDTIIDMEDNEVLIPTAIRFLTEVGYEARRTNMFLDGKCIKGIEVNWN